MSRMEEMEGKPQTGLTLSGTIDSIISVVRQSRGEPIPTPAERKVTADELKELFHSDLAPRAKATSTESQERIDLATLRSALYDS